MATNGTAKAVIVLRWFCRSSGPDQRTLTSHIARFIHLVAMTGRAPAIVSAPTLWRFLRRSRCVEWARALAHSKTWRKLHLLKSNLSPGRMPGSTAGGTPAATVLAICITGLLGGPIGAASIPIAVNGAARTTIVMGKNADNLERRAGSELQTYLERLTGVTIKQVNETDLGSIDKNATLLLLGETNQSGGGIKLTTQWAALKPS